MKTLVASGLIVLSSFNPANAVVIRHDKTDDAYTLEQGPRALADMRHEGHGVLIAPQWVATVAHTVFYDYRGKTITLGNVAYEIEAVIFHPGYTKPAEGLFTGHSSPSQAYLRSNHDIALVKLKQPVIGVEPATLYRSDQEADQEFAFFGKGKTGTGLTGQIDGPARGVLRRATNTVDSAQNQWLYYDFDKGNEGLPNEGMQGAGDSGGAVFARVDGQEQVIGLVSWNLYDGDIADFKGGLYGMSGALVRLSYYANWIDDVQGWSTDKLLTLHNKIKEP